MDHLQKFSSKLKVKSFLVVAAGNVLGILAFIGLYSVAKLPTGLALSLAALIAIILSYLAAFIIMAASNEPLKAIWQAVWHISPHEHNVPAIRIEDIKNGREVVEALTAQIYEMAAPTSPATQPAVNLQTQTAAGESALLRLLPLPVVALNKAKVITFVNQIAADYFAKPLSDLVGANANDVLQMAFSSQDTFEKWLGAVTAGKVTDSKSWDRVRLQLPDEKGVRQFDLIAHYTKDNPSGYETLLAFFDHTNRYSTEDTSASYVALAVHELRTPLTVLRGYIEVFEDELGDKLTPELKDFMHKMSASAQTLTAFVSNILNVARIDENQLTLSLHEASWNELLPQICQDLELRARVRGIALELNITPNLPTVAVDKVSIYEVMSNLVDNAIKYSDDSKKITISAALGKDGQVETTVRDYGIGMPDSVIKQLFTKFYRSHRSKGKVSGSGLGLYLVKAMVGAHGGEVWVQSKEGEGSVFGFSLQPYAAVAAQLKDTGGANIERQAHGWIKNHSLYRR